MPSSRDTGYRIAHVNYREADADTLLPPVQKCAFEVPISSARYEVTGDLEIDTDVGCEAHSVLHAVDPTVQHADAESQTDHVPGFGEVAPEVSAKNVLKLLNRARCNPKSMAGLLERRALLVDATDRIEKADRVFLQLAEGRKAVDNCIRVMLLATPVPELTLSAELTRAAQDHVEDLGPKGLTGHTGSAGDSTWKRVARHCEWRVHCAENIDYMSTSAPEIVLSMLVDDDVPSRGHRKMILKSDFTKVGIAYGPHKDYGTICVLIFAVWVGPKMDPGVRKVSCSGVEMSDELAQLLDSTPFGEKFGSAAAAMLRQGGEVLAERKWDGKSGELKVVLTHNGANGRTTRTLKGKWKS
mmetsp:Transcript_25038/g.63518  ORF Transcript_25038/g.63518 Transcript_25038/m.63518 type:complete len:356 (-) Transcript_25038:44-1111(-)